MIVARLNDGVTVDQALSAEDPSTVVTGLQTVNAAPGASADLTADLVVGTWVVVCFLPAADGQPHVAHGMITTFTVE